MSAVEEATRKFRDGMAGTGIDSMSISSPGHEPVDIKFPSKKSQLSFEIGGEAVGQRVFGTVSVAGSLQIDRNLDLGDEVSVRVVNAQGEVIASGGAIVGAPNFKTTRDQQGEIIATERAHKAKVF